MLSSNLLLLNLGGQEVILIVVLALLLFGGKKIPELMRGVGKGIREFKDASNGVKRDIEESMEAKDSEKLNSGK
ncbi:MAG: twin-arginine translocase TatA/TatE family subunit [bacterium]|jgi:sec-independent protein translocase protein TatA